MFRGSAVAGTTRKTRRKNIPSAAGLTYAQLLTEAGGVGQERMINDPLFPSIDSEMLDFVGSDPLAGVDWTGLEGRFCAIPINDGAGGWWRWRKWPQNALDTNNRIDLNLVGAVDDDDISDVLTRLATRYVNGTFNALWMEGLDDVSTVWANRWNITGDGTASELRWFGPLTSSCILKSAPWVFGSTDLMISGNWSEVVTNKWEITVVGTVGRFFTKDPNYHAGNGGTLPPNHPFWRDMGEPQVDVASISGEGNRQWHFATTTLTVGCTQNPAIYYDDMRYMAANEEVDALINWTAIHKIYCENGYDHQLGGTGLAFHGRAGEDPMAGYLPSDGDPLGPRRPLVQINAGTGMTEAGSIFNWYISTGHSSYIGFHLNNVGASSRKYETCEIGGLHSASYHPGTSTSGLRDQNGYAGGAKGPAFDVYQRNGSSSWGFQINSNTVTIPNNAAAEYRGNRGISFNSIGARKWTGRFAGSGVIPFFGSDVIQLGTSINDRVEFFLYGGGYAKWTGNDTPNGRWVHAGSSNSITVKYGKMDSWQCNRNSIAFVKYTLNGVTDRAGNIQTVDIIDASSLNVLADPAVRDVGHRNPITAMEATQPNSNYGSTHADCLWVNGPDSAEQGNIIVEETDFRYVQNVIGNFTHRGDGVSDMYIAFTEACSFHTFRDLIFAELPTYPNSDRAVSIQSGNQPWMKPIDNKVIDCTIKGDRYFPVIRSGNKMPPVNTLFDGLTVEGPSRDIVEIDPGEASEYTLGHPVTVLFTNTSGIRSGDTVDIIAGRSGVPVYISPDNGVNWYEPPYNFSGVGNTLKPADPPGLYTLNGAFTDPGTADFLTAFMPAHLPNNSLVVLKIVWDGNPASLTKPASWNHIAAMDANSADGSTYVKYYWKYFAVGTDGWDWDGFNISEGDWNWTGTLGVTAYAQAFRGAHATAPIGANSTSQANVSSATPSSPTITTTNANAMLFYGIGVGDVIGNTGFTGGPGGDIMHLGQVSSGVYGIEDAATLSCAGVYPGAIGSKAGIGYQLQAAAQSVGSTLEVLPA